MCDNTKTCIFNAALFLLSFNCETSKLKYETFCLVNIATMSVIKTLCRFDLFSLYNWLTQLEMFKICGSKEKSLTK